MDGDSRVDFIVANSGSANLVYRTLAYDANSFTMTIAAPTEMGSAVQLDGRDDASRSLQVESIQLLV